MEPRFFLLHFTGFSALIPYLLAQKRELYWLNAVLQGFRTGWK